MYIGMNSQSEDDDQMGYLKDWVIKYCEEKGIKVEEDIWQKDVAAKEFMIYVLKSVGIFKNE